MSLRYCYALSKGIAACKASTAGSGYKGGHEGGPCTQLQLPLDREGSTETLRCGEEKKFLLEPVLL